MKEQLISFETAKLAKDKGFDIPCMHRIHSSHCHFYKAKGMEANIPFHDEFLPKIRDWNNHKEHDKYNNQGMLILYLSIPTQSLLQKWLREKQDIHVDITPFSNTDGYEYLIMVLQKHYDKKIKIDSFTTYEQALEKGLFEALKLIK